MTMVVPEGKFAIVFDPALPIEPQLKRAKAALVGKQGSLPHLGGGKAKPEVRPRVENFASYLRVLDAKAVGAGDREIAAVLFPKLDEPDGVRQVQNHYRAAKRIRDVDYRIYALGHEPSRRKVNIK